MPDLLTELEVASGRDLGFFTSQWLQTAGVNTIAADWDEEDGEFTRFAIRQWASPQWPTLRRQAGFEVGVATLPYHEEYYGAPQNTLADGPAMWVGAGKKAADYKAVAQFIDYWLTPDQQGRWWLERNAPERAAVHAMLREVLVELGAVLECLLPCTWAEAQAYLPAWWDVGMERSGEVVPNPAWGAWYTLRERVALQWSEHSVKGKGALAWARAHVEAWPSEMSRRQRCNGWV